MRKAPAAEQEMNEIELSSGSSQRTKNGTAAARVGILTSGDQEGKVKVTNRPMGSSTRRKMGRASDSAHNLYWEVGQCPTNRLRRFPEIAGVVNIGSGKHWRLSGRLPY